MLKNATKQIFADAICSLAKTKPINKITINDITEYCNAGRQTFYYHFKDKYELISWIYTNNANQILGVYDNFESFRDHMRKIYQHFVCNKEFYTKIIKIDGQNSFTSALFNHAYKFYINSIAERFGQEELTDDLIFTIEFNCYGAVNMCKKWMLSGMIIPADEMADKIVDHIPHCLKKYFI